jgi:hypothetical protein
MGFVGSSMVEGTNVKIKQGIYAAKPSINIDIIFVYYLNSAILLNV